MTVQLIRRAAVAAACLATAAATCTALAAPALADTDGTNVVINEVYGGGGNSGATYTNDFIELYNPTNAAISLTDWSVQYASSGGNTWQVTALSGSIAAGGYYLVQEAQGSGGTTPLPDPDATGSIAMSGTHGKVALLTTTTGLDTATPVHCDSSCPTGLVDFVGFGTDASDYEGSAAAPELSNSTSDSRTNGADTDNNATDFAEGAPTPQNSGDSGGSSPAPLALANPGDQQAYAGVSMADIDLSATGGQSPYTWSATGLPDGLKISYHGGSIYGTPTTVGTWTVTVTVTDDDQATASASFDFTISEPKHLTIAQIQGTNTDTSPYPDGTAVRTEGVVTAVYATGGFNGIYLQTAGTGGNPHRDKTPGASDAVFVYGSDSAGQVTIGESVSVTGEVSEYSGTTEISFPTVTKLDHRLKRVTPTTIAWSGLQTDAQKEAHEGELLAPQGDFTVSSNYDVNYFGTFMLAAGTTPLVQPTDVGPAGSPAAKDAVADNARRAIVLDDGSSWALYPDGDHSDSPMPWLTAQTPARVGSQVTFHQGVVLRYEHSAWSFEPTTQVVGDGSAVATFSGNGRADNERPADVGGDIRLATFNVENYFSTTGEEYVASGQGTCTYYDDREGNHIGDNRCHDEEGNPGPRGAATAESFARQQDKIVTGINRLGASIVSLEEIENSVKFNKDRDDALAGLVEALNDAAGSDVWAYVPSPAAADLPPVAQQDVIRTGFIYKPTDVTPVGVSHVLADQSGEGQPFSIAREPLAQAFKKAGVPDSYSFLVVANHFKSKGADADGIFDDCANGGDGEAADPAYDQGAFNCTRVHEARAVVTFAEDTAAEVGTDKIFLLGDLNAYTHEDPMQVLYDAGYTDLSSTFDPSEQSYNYNDLAGSLDHVLANPAALSMVTGADIWQINAQESVAYAYSRYNYNVTQLFDGDEPFAASDHNPEVVGLALPSPVPGWDASTVYHAGDQVTYDGSTWQALWWTQNQTPGDPYGPWQEMTTAPDGTAIWTASRVFHAGDVVLYQGSRHVAQWYTRNQAPGQPYGPWKPVG